jgi:hypothetical protein
MASLQSMKLFVEMDGFKLGEAVNQGARAI